jgi:hypothetical protein
MFKVIFTPLTPAAAEFAIMLVHSNAAPTLLPGTGAIVKNPAKTPVPTN